MLLLIINYIYYDNYSNDCSNNDCNISDNLYCNITLNISHVPDIHECLEMIYTPSVNDTK